MPLDQVSNEEIEKAEFDEQGNLRKDDAEMSFLEHLEVLRWHIIRAVIALILCTLVAFSYGTWIFDNIIFAPADNKFITYRVMCRLGEMLNTPFLCVKSLNFDLQSRILTGQFMMHLTYSFVIGLIVSFPYMFWEIWRFIKPALYNKERGAARGAVFFVSLLFLIGALFGYYVVAPLSINFLAGYQISTKIKNQFDIVSYVGVLTTLVVGCAVLFQLPVVVYFLAKVGVITAKFMRTYRRHAILVIFLIAAVITPSPDIFTQVLVGAPLLILYEISISIAARVQKKLEAEGNVK
jgi:sec-independent protein translocase protein TatC